MIFARERAAKFGAGRGKRINKMGSQTMLARADAVVTVHAAGCIHAIIFQINALSFTGTHTGGAAHTTVGIHANAYQGSAGEQTKQCAHGAKCVAIDTPAPPS